LTVSPVPLIATYEPRHALVSTTYSKAALRVAADEVERKFDNVFYFPSYEIITSPTAGGLYYHDDLREVRDAGVNHVMRIFTLHFMNGADPDVAHSTDLGTVHRHDVEIVCDEEVIQSSIRISRVDAS
jgi:hypothetical protein